MTTLIPEIASIADEGLSARLQKRIDSKTKPLGALGKLETLAHRIGSILGTEEPVLREPQMLVCAADHGLAAKGVSAYPSDVTWQMVENFLAGGAAVSVLARQNGLALTVVDCGVAREIPQREHRLGAPRLVSCRIAAGTQDASVGPAMTMAQCEQAIENGKQLVKNMPGNAVMLGEMGIGNTSVASLLLARLGGVSLAECTGAGTGLNAAGVARKLQILETALQANADAKQPLQALAALGGFEVATLTGAVLQAAAERRVIVVDGFITTAAVLVASQLQPAVLERCVFAHRSGEPGHTHMLRLLKGDALLDMGLRLGEGSGAALAWPLLESACVFLREMASFESAGVDGSNAA
ncbi:nicotinate-nucleotide--dimethylbenzimidazole phosphoribosyltransferase [Diaphorobacter sp. HDW4B]|uniref:nicotinate-nucleotide--dimethylbenzimidazole phosphoribosyltransferase n=1 Tax=Diaphorobacter sp. HDW4B TaxID=2714925 RepID=UPI001409A8A9|nr:nicotinate-nucleotide--dimethylbenzimidazole phosphoribosyltransferase [Diaphorobacter sp. HDW4B]QIL69625.1 nicotinate-nucleotide--dimethylbenzimidazole phosphoribosyltransferase [Diaphorobacter sp. HDW4B]